MSIARLCGSHRLADSAYRLNSSAASSSSRARPSPGTSTTGSGEAATASTALVATVDAADVAEGLDLAWQSFGMVAGEGAGRDIAPLPRGGD